MKTPMFFFHRKSCRRFSNGRLVGNIDATDTNAWLTCSELAICGRPLTDNQAVLPLSKDILLPESLSTEDDLRQSERVRPSVETSSAQKGVARWTTLLSSMLNLTGTSFVDKRVIVLNLTPYIEDVGCSASWLVILGGKENSADIQRVVKNTRFMFRSRLLIHPCLQVPNK